MLFLYHKKKMCYVVFSLFLLRLFAARKKSCFKENRFFFGISFFINLSVKAGPLFIHKKEQGGIGKINFLKCPALIVGIISFSRGGVAMVFGADLPFSVQPPTCMFKLNKSEFWFKIKKKTC